MQGHRKERLRLYPTPAQEAQLRNFAGAHRWAWNWALAAREQHYAAVGETLTYYAQGCALTQVQRQPETAWLQGIPRRVKVGALRDLDRAYRAAFARIKRGEPAGFPRFKTRKSDRASFEIPHEVRLADGRVWATGIGWIRARGARPVDGDLRGGRFFRDRAGAWWVTLTYTFEIPDPAPIVPTEPVGVHLQLQHAASLSDGTTIPPLAVREAEKRKRRRLHKAMARKRPGSANREKARRRLARHMRRTANRRHHFLHTLSHDLVTHHGTLVLQARNTAAFLSEPESQRAAWGGVKRSARIADAAWSTLLEMLTYKSQWAGRPAIIVPVEFPSARMCSACGAINVRLTVAQRQWTCSQCGARHGRGVNAAQNLLSVAAAR